MGTGGRVVLRRGHGVRRRRKLDGDDDDDDDDDDEEYVVDEEEEDDEEEEEEEVAAASSDEEGEEEVEVEDESDADFEEEAEDEEFEIEVPWPKRQAKGGHRGRKGKPAGSRRRRHEEDEDYEEELEEEDEDFDPDADEEEEEDDDELDEEEDEDEDEEEEFGAIRTKKIRSKNQSGKRKPACKRQQRKNKKNGSRVSRRKARKGVPVQRRRKRSVTDEYEDEEEEENEEDDEDFFVEDRVEVNQRPRKKAKVGRKTRAGTLVPVVEAETWPSLDSDTSDFEFVTSEEDFAEKEPLVAETARIKGRKRRKRISVSESSSDSDYVISEEELRDLGVIGPPKAVPLLLAPPPRRTFVSRKGEEKGKEKEKGTEEAWKPTCGICLSEEQKATVQGVLNCCPHYFCFACIMEWSKVESRCPLCKRRFTTITKSSKADLGLGLRKAVIKVEKRDQVYQPSEEEMRRWLDPYENVVCIECNQGGDDNLMLLCDICDSSAHTYCVGLGREVPEGNWYCGGCRSAGEGPSYTQIQDRVVHHGESNSSHADSSSEAFSTAAPSRIFQRPPPVNIHPSFQEFDLNLSPREIPEEDQRAESRVSVDAVSTPPGRRATLSGRRAIHQRIRIFLSRPRPMIRPNVWHNGVQDGTIPETEVNSSHSMADAIQNQQCSSPFFQPASNFSQCTYGDANNFQQIEGAKDQVLHVVKSSLKRMRIQFPLDGQSAFKNIARRAKHTILAACGLEHNRDMVVATHHHPPNNCCHALDGREPAFLMRNCCSLCFSSFVSDVVNVIANMFS